MRRRFPAEEVKEDKQERYRKAVPVPRMGKRVVPVARMGRRSVPVPRMG